MPQTSNHNWCSMKLIFHVIDCLAILLIIVLQGSILDYYLILHNGGSAAWYFWFLADFLILIAFMAAAVISYRFYKKARLRKIEEPESPRMTPTSKFGSLPLVYVVWIFYSLLLTAKVILLFKLRIAQNLDAESTFGPQLLKIVIASSAVVFLLLVETHNDAEPHSDNQAYIYYLITSIVFEIFDSVTFLGILFVSETKILLTFHLENLILCFSCANFILPAVALYKLSLSEFGAKPRNLGLKLLYKFLHLVMINVPYFTIRVYLWTLYDQEVTLFLLKNILAILLLLRTAYPDLQLWWQMVQENKRKRSCMMMIGASDLNAVYEISDIQLEERQLDDDGKKVPMMTQL